MVYLGTFPLSIARGGCYCDSTSDTLMLGATFLLGRRMRWVVTVEPTNPEENLTTVHFTCVQTEGRWLIDQVIEFHTHAEEASEATPEA